MLVGCLKCFGVDPAPAPAGPPSSAVSQLRKTFTSPVILLWWHFVLIIWSLLNYLRSLRDSERVSFSLQQAYVGFLVVNAVMVFSIGGGSFCTALGKKLSQRARRSAINMGVGCIFFAGDTPLFFINLFIINEEGVFTAWLGIDAVLRCLSWCLGFLYLWISYIDVFAEHYHERALARRNVRPSFLGAAAPRERAQQMRAAAAREQAHAQMEDSDDEGWVQGLPPGALTQTTKDYRQL